MLRLHAISSTCHLRMRSASNWDDKLLIARYWRSRHMWENRSSWCLQSFTQYSNTLHVYICSCIFITISAWYNSNSVSQYQKDNYPLPGYSYITWESWYKSTPEQCRYMSSSSSSATNHHHCHHHHQINLYSVAITVWCSFILFHLIPSRAEQLNA